jgi:hypothetical protein
LLSAWVTAYNTLEVPGDLYAPNVRAVSLCGKKLTGAKLLRESPEKLLGTERGRYLVALLGRPTTQVLTEEVHLVSCDVQAMSKDEGDKDEDDMYGNDVYWRDMHLTLTVTCKGNTH